MRRCIEKKNSPPVFQRWSWAKFFPGSCLYVSDPTLYLDKDLGLAWYGGNQFEDPLPVILEFIRSVVGKLGLATRDVYLYGSSGGGFAALRLLTLAEEMCAIVINPQTSVTNYERKHVEKYLSIAFGHSSRAKAKLDYKERLDILHKADTLRNSRLIYIQNDLDEHHYHEHYVPLCEALGESNEASLASEYFKKIIFSDVGGHGKAETQEAFDSMMGIIDGGF